MLRLATGTFLVSLAAILSTTETFFIRSRLRDQLNAERDADPDFLPFIRARSPQLGRMRTRLLRLNQQPGALDDFESLSERNRVEKRMPDEIRGVVFPWNEWKCQVRGCRKH